MPFKKNDPNINRKGRRKNSKNKVPSDKDIQDAFLKEAVPTLQKLLDIRDNEKSKEDSVIKVCAKILDISYKILIDRQEGLGRQLIPKATSDKSNNKEEQEKPKEKTMNFSLTAVK